MGTSKLLWGQLEKMLAGNLHWTGITSRSLHTTESRDKSWPDGPLPRPFTIGGRLISH